MVQMFGTPWLSVAWTAYLTVFGIGCMPGMIMQTEPGGSVQVHPVPSRRQLTFFVETLLDSVLGVDVVVTFRERVPRIADIRTLLCLMIAGGPLTGVSTGGMLTSRLSTLRKTNVRKPENCKQRECESEFIP
jgi:hypothetical protein